MKSSSDFLWHLIHSLTKNEKLFFKRNFAVSRSKTESLYIKLFDEIARQKEYDEAAILKKFEPALSKKNIAHQKHYLQKQICDAIITYDNQVSDSRDIYDQVKLVRIYRKKGLIDEAHSAWKKAVISARNSESFALLNLLKTEFEKMVLSSNHPASYDELHDVFKGNIITYTEYAEMITLRDLYTEILLLKRKAHFDQGQELRKKTENLLAKIERTSSCTSFQSFWFRHYYSMSKATLLYLSNNSAAAMGLLQQVFTAWKQNPRYIKTHGEYYIEVLYMINYAGVLNGDYQYVLNCFEDRLNEELQEPVQRANFEVVKFLALNKVYNKTGKYEDVETLVDHMKKKYRHWEPTLSDDMNNTVNISLGIACFVLHQYADALYFIKRAITYFRDGREEHAAAANMLLLLVSYEMNNSRLFDAQYRSTYNYFYKRKKSHVFETALISCLHRTFYTTETKKRSEEFQKALEIFKTNKEDVTQQRSFNIFNYPGWLTSKVLRLDYKEYVQRQLKKEATAVPAL